METPSLLAEACSGQSTASTQRWAVQAETIKTLGHYTSHNDSGKVVHTHVPLLPSRITLYQPRQEGQVTADLALHWPYVTGPREREWHITYAQRDNTLCFHLLNTTQAYGE